MLKIKNNVDLKELEKYGFKRNSNFPDGWAMVKTYKKGRYYQEDIYVWNDRKIGGNMKIEKITIYELLGLVKDGKAPEKIKYEYSTYELTPEKNEYYCKNEMRWFTNEINSLGVLNNYVEIIEEDKEIEKIEIVNNGNMNAYAIYSADGVKCALTKHSKVMCDKINELIDKVNSLKNKQ